MLALTQYGFGGAVPALAVPAKTVPRSAIAVAAMVRYLRMIMIPPR
jgi:hypothetical protein